MYSLKRVKFGDGSEVSGSLWDATKRVARFHRTADGALTIDWMTKKAQRKFESHLTVLKTTQEGFMASLIESEWLKETSAKHTVYRLDTMPEGMWHVLNVKFTPEVREIVVAQHRGQIVTFGNDLIAKK